MVHSTCLPNSHEWHVREAARLPSALCWIKSYQAGADGSHIVVYLAICREIRYCSFNPKTKNKTKPKLKQLQIVNFNSREKTKKTPKTPSPFLPPPVLGTQAGSDLQIYTGTCAAEGWHSWPLRWR